MHAAQLIRGTLAAWPQGYFVVAFRGRRYGVSSTSHAGGRSRKLYAEELGGSDFVSPNLYEAGSGGPALHPCEMPMAKVIDFVREAVLEAT